MKLGIIGLPMRKVCFNNEIPGFALHIGCRCSSTRNMFEYMWSHILMDTSTISFSDKKNLSTKGTEVFKAKILQVGPEVPRKKDENLFLLMVQNVPHLEFLREEEIITNVDCLSCSVAKSLLTAKYFEYNTFEKEYPLQAILWHGAELDLQVNGLNDVTYLIECGCCYSWRRCVLSGGFKESDIFKIFVIENNQVNNNINKNNNTFVVAATPQGENENHFFCANIKESSFEILNHTTIITFS
jgi:hypothetical protein